MFRNIVLKIIVAHVIEGVVGAKRLAITEG